MKNFFLLWLTLFSLSSSAQEMWGISNSNYSGNMGIFLNPATIVGAPYRYEINLIAGDFFAHNSYIFLEPKRTILVRTLTGNAPTGTVAYDRFNGKSQNLFAHALLIGPSYINNKDGRKAWGMHSAFRSELSVVKAQPVLSKFIYENFDYPAGFGNVYSGSPLSAAWLTWAELGATYGKVYKETPEKYIKWAATGNLLLGFDGAYLDVRKLDYTVYDPDHTVIHAMDATLAHAMNPVGGGFFSPRGAGLSMTLGAQYIRKRNPNAYDCNNTSDAFRKYKYRLGLSVMDIGAIHFFRASQVMNVSTTNDRVWQGLDTVKFSSLLAFDSTLAVRNEYSSTEKKTFSIWLPAALSLQFDYCLAPRIYANASWLNRMRIANHEVLRGNQMDLSIRYEKKNLEANVNFSLFQYSQPSMGIAFRYYFLVLGTDRLLEWLDLVDIYTFDLFFGIKWNLCELPFKKKAADCPAFGPVK